MGKRFLLGCSALLVLVAVGLAVLIALNRDTSGVDSSDNAADSLQQELAGAFGGSPLVKFTCTLPLVGEAPCVVDNDAVIRQVTLTFSNYVLPDELAPEEQARRVAALAFHTSAFVKRSDETSVIFETTEQGEFARLSRTSTFSFAREELAAAAAVEPGEPGEAKTPGE